MFWGCDNRSKRPGSAATPETSRSSRNPLLGFTLQLVTLYFTAGPTAFAETAHEPYACGEPAAPPALKHIVIILDDLGHNLARGREAVALPGRLTYAVIPFTAHGSTLAEEAHAAGKEVMLHAPMSTLERTQLGKGGLTPQLSRQEFNDALVAGLEDIPHASGVNNHMGSDLTRRRQQMAWLMRELRWQDLYFVDSRTNKETVAATVAAEFNVPHLSRHVFLDNERTQAAIAERFRVLLEKAGEDGLAVAIGHPYPETLAFLRGTLPDLGEEGVKLVAVSEALALQENTDLAASNAETDSEADCCPAC